MRPSLCALTVLVLFLNSTFLQADPPNLQTLKIGSQAPDFNLLGVDGKHHKLEDYADARLLVVIFNCNHCPTSQGYEPRIMKMVEDYKDRGVQVVAISSSDTLALRADEFGYSDLDDSYEHMKIRAKEKSFNFPYLYDGDTQKVAFEYGALATPHAFLFDEHRALRYVGRIDDTEVREPSSPDLLNAINALLEGKAVPVEETRNFGCSTKWSDKRPSAVAAAEEWDKLEVSIKSLDEEAIKNLMKNDTDEIIILNIWATYCVPCMQELPDLVQVKRSFLMRPVRVVTLTLDDPSQEARALRVLKKFKVAGENYITTIEDPDKLADLVDKEWKGPLPYTLVIAPGGEIVYRKEGQFETRELRSAVLDKIGRTYGFKFP